MIPAMKRAVPKGLSFMILCLEKRLLMCSALASLVSLCLSGCFSKTQYIGMGSG